PACFITPCPAYSRGYNHQGVGGGGHEPGVSAMLRPLPYLPTFSVTERRLLLFT
ncbi:hypothetical protein KUCAC02_001353, partial [Chaenocephalus aceratus]